MLAAFLLIAAVSCKKDAVKNETVPSPLSAKLLSDSNFVSISVAGSVVKYAELSTHQSKQSVNSGQVLQAKPILDSVAIPNASNPSYYIFNYEGGGFAIIPADKRVQPILAYNDKGHLERSDNLAPGLQDWLTITDKNMDLIRKHPEVKAPKEISRMWNAFVSKKATQKGLKTQQLEPTPVCEEYQYLESVGPLLQTTWDQNYPYNALCPAGSYSGGHTPTGCVATAMAQVMNYWHFPTSYSWSSIPSSPYSYNYTLGQVMLDAGSAVNMDYDDSGSTPHSDFWHSPKTPSDGLTGALGYGSATHANFNFWDTKTNLVNHWPVILTGYRGSGQIGHCWVCDGYNQWYFYTCETPSSNPDVYTVLLFHMNWGWGSNCDGYYAYAGWYPSSGGVQVDSFPYNKLMDYNIHP